MNAGLARTGNCLDSQDISPKVPAVGDVLTFQTPGGWTPEPPGASLDGAIGLSIVYMPTTAPTPDANNCYHTEASFRAALAALLLVTCGPITVAVDGTGVFPASPQLALGPLDCADGRVFWLGANDFNAFPAVNTLHIKDGSSLVNPGGAARNIQIEGECTTAPAFRFTAPGGALAGNGRFFYLGSGGELVNLGAHAFCDLGPNVSLSFFQKVLAGMQIGGAGPMFNLTAASAVLIFLAVGQGSGPSGYGAANLVAGIAGSNLYLNVDDTFPLNCTNPTFLGTLHKTLLSLATGDLYLETNQPTAPFGAGIPRTMQEAHMMGQTWVTHVAANYSVDSGPSIDGQIATSVALITFFLPFASAYPGREITFVNTSGSAGGTAFTLQPHAGDTIGPLGAGVARAILDVEATSVTIKSQAPASPNAWLIIASTSLA